MNIRSGRAENNVAKDVRDAFAAKLSPERYTVEVDDGEDILIKKKEGQPDFALELRRIRRAERQHQDRRRIVRMSTSAPRDPPGRACRECAMKASRILKRSWRSSLPRAVRRRYRRQQSAARRAHGTSPPTGSAASSGELRVSR